MRKLAGATTPCQSKAAVTRFTRSPPAAKKVATARMSTSARSAIGSRTDSRGDGQPALSLRADKQRAFDMGAPERLRDRIVSVGGDLVGDRGGRPVRLAAAAVEPAQAVGGAGQPQHRQRRRRDRGDQDEQQQPDGARQRRQHQPQSGPGKCEEQSERGRQRGQRRPQPLPQQAAACALERPRQQGPGRVFPLLWLLVQTVQKPLRRQG